jgi:hypothetical protein
MTNVRLRLQKHEPTFSMSNQAAASYVAEAEVETSNQIAAWLESLSRHPACPPERRFWYEGVAGDIRNGAYWRSHA